MSLIYWIANLFKLQQTANPLEARFRDLADQQRQTEQVRVDEYIALQKKKTELLKRAEPIVVRVLNSYCKGMRCSFKDVSFGRPDFRVSYQLHDFKRGVPQRGGNDFGEYTKFEVHLELDQNGNQVYVWALGTEVQVSANDLGSLEGKVAAALESSF